MENSYNYDPFTGAPLGRSEPEKPKPKREFTKKETVFAWLSALVGYLFCRTFLVWQKPAVGLAFTVCLFAFAFAFPHGEKRRARSLFYPVSALVLASSLFLSSGPVVLALVFAYDCVAFSLYCQTGSENALEPLAGQLYIFEVVKAIFVSPFKSIDAAAGAVSSNKGVKKLGKTLLIALAGVAVAIVPTVIVALLLSFDENFSQNLNALRVAVFSKLFSHALSLLIGVPFGMYIYASLYTSAHPTADSFNAENCENVEDKLKFAPSLVGAVAIAPLLFLYVVFIVAQFDYYKAVFTGTIPAAWHYADFARDGFFRLCVVAAINALAMIALRVFSKKTASGKISPVVKVYTVVLSLVTVIISGTAISQMLMYVSKYGLTRLRLYTLWFMSFIILLFLVTVFKQFFEKLPFAATTLTLFVVCFALIAVPDADAVIARHNYNCHVSGATRELDVSYLGQLSPSSVPVLCEIVENEALSDEFRYSALCELAKYKEEHRPTFNLPSLLADNAYNSLSDETRDMVVRQQHTMY